MMSTDPVDGPRIYELTVVGSMGTVFRSAVRPHSVGLSEVCTVLLAGSTQDRDMSELVLLLHEQGLSVQGVLAVGEGAACTAAVQRVTHCG
jgi:hypothetical protein